MSRFGETKSERAFSAVAIFLAVLYMAGGLSVWLGIANPNEAARSMWGLAGLAAGISILLGVWTRERSPVLASLLVFAGAIPLAVVLAGAILPPVLAAFLTLLWARTRWDAAKRKRLIPSQG